VHTERAAELLGRLDALRVELVDLAYLLERRGRLDAADVALAVAGRVGEFQDEFDVRLDHGRAGASVEPAHAGSET
jgi:hypothetical protein